MIADKDIPSASVVNGQRMGNKKQRTDKGLKKVVVTKAKDNHENGDTSSKAVMLDVTKDPKLAQSSELTRPNTKREGKQQISPHDNTRMINPNKEPVASYQTSMETDEIMGLIPSSVLAGPGPI